MKIDFDKQRLKEILIDFYNFTKINISIFDWNFNNIVAYPEFLPKYCEKIRQDETRYKNCLASDICACKKSSEIRKSITYTCHAGLCETVMPIFYENINIGYIIFGQYADTSLEYSSVKTVEDCCKNYNIDVCYMKEKYNELISLTHSQITSAINILQMCIRQIWLEQLIKLDKDILATNIEFYIATNLDKDLTVNGLCKKFYISKKRLYKIFSDNYNQTIKNYVTEKRLEKAKLLLKLTNDSISKIAGDVGIFDYNNFIKLFKKSIGLTPLQFRKNKTF